LNSSWLHEIFGESIEIAPYSQVEVAGGHLVQVSQVRIEHDFLAADVVDSALDERRGYQQRISRCLLFGHEHSGYFFLGGYRRLCICSERAWRRIYVLFFIHLG